MYPWPDGGSSSEGVPEDCGPSCCLQGAESRRHFLSALCVSLLPFPFPSPSHSSSPFGRVTGPVSPALVASPSLTAFTFLCRKGCAGEQGSLSSCGLHSLCGPVYLLSDRGTNILGILVYRAVSFPFTPDPLVVDV